MFFWLGDNIRFFLWRGYPVGVMKARLEKKKKKKLDKRESST